MIINNINSLLRIILYISAIYGFDYARSKLRILYFSNTVGIVILLTFRKVYSSYGHTGMRRRGMGGICCLQHTGDADTEVREAACAALGAAMAVIGEKPMMTMMGDIADDKLKMGKV